MLEAEDVGLYKFDILSQRGLSKIRESLDIIAYNQPEKAIHDIHDITFFKKDKKIQSLLQNGEAMGCFYVESPAMRMLMKKLNTTTYLRSEEHTSELQSRPHLVCRLLLEKKN